MHQVVNKGRLSSCPASPPGQHPTRPSLPVCLSPGPAPHRSKAPSTGRSEFSVLRLQHVRFIAGSVFSPAMSCKAAAWATAAKFVQKFSGNSMLIDHRAQLSFSAHIQSPSASSCLPRSTAYLPISTFAVASSSSSFPHDGIRIASSYLWRNPHTRGQSRQNSVRCCSAPAQPP